MRDGGAERDSRGAAVGARERLPVGRGDLRVGSGGRAPRGAAVAARERLPVGRDGVRWDGEGRSPRGAEVVARERARLGTSCRARSRRTRDTTTSRHGRKRTARRACPQARVNKTNQAAENRVNNSTPPLSPPFPRLRLDESINSRTCRLPNFTRRRPVQTGMLCFRFRTAQRRGRNVSR